VLRVGGARLDRDRPRGQALAEALLRQRPRSGLRAQALRQHGADAGAQERVERAASGLRATGIGRGDRVLVIARNTADYLLVWFALMEVGAIQVR